MNKLLLILIFLLGISGGVYYAWSQSKMDDLSSDLAKARVSADSTTQLNDSLAARLASTDIDKESLQAALAAAEELNAELVAAARVRVVGETTTRIDTVPTIIEGETRIASVVDTMPSGILDLKVTAPPFPAELELAYTYTPLPIDITIGLLRLEDNSAIFSATWSGGRTEIEAPFARLPAKPKTFAPYAAGGYDLATASVFGKVGADLNVFNWFSLYGELLHLVPVKQNLDPELEYPTHLMLGVAKRF